MRTDSVLLAIGLAIGGAIETLWHDKRQIWKKARLDHKFTGYEEVREFR